MRNKKEIRISCLIITISLLLLGNVTARQEITWLTDYQQALSQAAEQNKLLLVFFQAGWCQWCAKMNRETFSHPDVITVLTQNFVSVKADIDKDVALTKKFNAYQVPAIFILDNDENVEGMSVGFTNSHDLLAFLEPIVYSRDHEGPEALVAKGDEYFNSNEYERATNFYKRAYDLYSEENDLKKMEETWKRIENCNKKINERESIRKTVEMVAFGILMLSMGYITMKR